MNSLPPLVAATRALDDCWNRIGSAGDQSCALLSGHIHCRNCPTHAAAATRLLDRPALLAEGRPGPAAGSTTRHALEPILVFRIGDEWLGLPARVVDEVIAPRPVHPLPHRRNQAVRGLVNVRGTLTVCFAVGDLLGIAPASHDYPGTIARMLVIGGTGRATAVPVDAVYGIERFPEDGLQPVPGTVGRAGATYTRAVAPWGAASVGLLDAQLLLYAIDRNLA